MKTKLKTKTLNHKNNSIAGFTLIELMIVIVIIGLLASIALPAYQNYINRAKITEGFQLATEQQSILSEWMNINGSLEETPFDPGENIPSSQGKYVDKIDISPKGQILIKFNNKSGDLSNKGFLLNPEVSEDKTRILNWSCEADIPENKEFIEKLLPSSCKNKK